MPKGRTTTSRWVVQRIETDGAQLLGAFGLTVPKLPSSGTMLAGNVFPDVASFPAPTLIPDFAKSRWLP